MSSNSIDWPLTRCAYVGDVARGSFDDMPPPPTPHAPTKRLEERQSPVPFDAQQQEPDMFFQEEVDMPLPENGANLSRSRYPQPPPVSVYPTDTSGSRPATLLQ